ncbi:diguanylate cyclase domain-containing protein [Maridesulfovibrio sp.]|uniref:diguanylate cyclase domain-containing protein n=1 Tax=Maridesulfovibrio sp. TaxID=2795000 RepID=UPI0029CA99B0|nr:diguanylate cyclase [Maridesulfovibrio sp.]
MNSIIITIDEKEAVKKSIILFLFLFLFFGCTAGGLVAIYYQSQLTTEISVIKDDQAASVTTKEKVIAHEFDDVTSDLLFLANQNEIKEYFNVKKPHFLRKVASEYLEMASHKDNYAQIRFIDVNGVEKIRIDNNQGKHFISPSMNLQDKSSRYYLKASERLKIHEVYVSPMDLNIENGKIERPFKPMIRFSTPIFDSNNLKQGYIIINYDAREMITEIVNAFRSDMAIPMLVNNDGYWLVSGDSEKDWGFVVPGRENHTFPNKYPLEWQQMVNREIGQLHTDNGMFTFVKTYPFKRSLSPNSAEVNNYWVLLTFIPHSVISGISSVLRMKLLFLGTGLFLFTTTVAWFLALAITKRKIYQSRLISLALHDGLTGLANRKLFYDRLETGLDLAERYGRRLGLLYIDLDGFKKINDDLGHVSGDSLLIKFSKLLKSLVRKTDTVARLGGDEFAIVLTEIESAADAIFVAKKITDSLALPIEIEGGSVNIGASIGIAVFPDMSRNLEELIHLADISMYKSKENGKNTFTLARL